MEGRSEGGGVREGVMRRGSSEEREWWRVRGVGGVGSDEGGVMEGEGSGSGVVGGGGVREEGNS